MNKDSDLLKCPICLDQYNLVERLPKLLPQCGHTICLECLSTLLRGHEPKCPLDKVCFNESHVELEQYPTNFSLRYLLEEDNQFDICPTHNARMEVVCFQDKVKICPFCALFSEHKTHELRYICDIQTEVAQKRKEVDAALKMRNDFQKNAENALEEKKQELLKIIEDRYEIMFTALKTAKEKMTGEFNTFFDKQKEKFKEVFDRDGLIMSTLTAKSVGFRDFAKKKDPFSVLDEDVSSLIPKLDNFSLEKPIQRIHDQLNDVSIYLSTILAIQPGFNAELEAPLKKFPEKASLVLADNLKEDLLMQPAQIGDLPFFEVLAPFKVEIADNMFKITAHNKSPENIQVNVDEWKQIKQAVFTVDQFAFNQKDLTWLGTMWNMLEGLTSVKFTAMAQPGLVDNNMTKLFSTLFSRIEALEEISVDFGSNKIGDECIKLFLDQLLPRAEKIKHISLGLVKTAVSNATIEGFTNKVLSKFKELETFKIDLGLTGVTENTVTQMFVELPKLKKLELGLNGLGVTDKTLEMLGRNVLNNSASLEDLEMKLWMSKVTDDGLSMLFNGMKDIKRLSMNLVGTSVTDKSMSVLVNSLNEKIKSLKDLDVFLWSTAVSQGVQGQLEEIKKARAA